MEFNDIEFDDLIERKKQDSIEALMLGWCKRKGYTTPIRNDVDCNNQIKEFCKEFNTTCNYILVEYGKNSDVASPYKVLLKVTREYEPELYHCNCAFYDIDHISDLIKCIIAEELHKENYMDKQKQRFLSNDRSI